MGVVFVCCGVLLLWGAWLVVPETVSTLRFATLGGVQLPSRVLFVVCGILSVGLGLLYVGHWLPPWLYTVSLGINTGGLVLSTLVWASMGGRLEVVGILTQTVRLATPIALGAMAGLLCERCGVINIALEGLMLSAACVGFIAALYAQHVWLGLLAAVVIGGLLAALHAALAIHGRVDQIISGTAINMLAIGGTGFLRRVLLLHNQREAPAVFPIWPIPLLSDLPILGQCLFRHQPLVYTMLLLVVVLHILLFMTRWGLHTRAVGEHPRAADTLGVNVFTIRYVNVIAGGMIAGLGGAWFSLETVGTFEDLMTGGKGFIALAAMIFGKWTPGGALGGALLFAFADALQIKLQIAGVNVPYQFLGMTPYLVTMLVLAGLIGRAHPPAADGVPYTRHAA
jgi:simple sugar transport system permease protein